MLGIRHVLVLSLLDKAVIRGFEGIRRGFGVFEEGPSGAG